MARYVDGYVLPVPKKNLAKYRKLAQMGKKMWLKSGALEYFECVSEDTKTFCGMSFPKAIKSKAGETVVFSFIVYKSRAHRDQVNAKVMKEMTKIDFDHSSMPFDMKRMIYGGFKVLVEG